ncbi:MAG TPA: MmcQ/YjbR family DNA-binding protein [Aquihabitans sp.]|jgi:predicted DNA-binding protein (MmcQ/YjbR family)|nr:MmcQ/YjbR family DNA-binding protein [Aquihabitans sp.]
MARPNAAATRDRLRAFALDLPDAVEDHPWGDDVIKTNGGRKIFLFLGGDDPDRRPSIGVKLADSHEQALGVPGVEPSGYGLGRSGWVVVPLGDGAPPVAVLEDWVEESYRLVALKRNVRALDERSA